ncbi:hypothetical protein DLAC_03681 [Tieghemostelium lacteum]|uniref:Uncharacterized protein n=1 Tax=Tieghemostelium lacteum TaxID=361077 RepID=A0A152A0F5_TIELA|nr:hypothetical protein DLAC_03681 [Tieghemostelium lacteum]|eukprot:KYQ99741.1 hypothetical protein DLAC_03681 [Tieghemostelium lacteum]
MNIKLIALIVLLFCIISIVHSSEKHGGRSSGPEKPPVSANDPRSDKDSCSDNEHEHEYHEHHRHPGYHMNIHIDVYSDSDVVESYSDSDSCSDHDNGRNPTQVPTVTQGPPIKQSSQPPKFTPQPKKK